MNRVPNVVFFISLLALSCDGATAGQLKAPASVAAAEMPRQERPAAAPESAPDEAPLEPVDPVVLADSPRIDLLLNRSRWHLYRDGLVLPFAAEGIRKYTQEYSQPLGPLVELDGRRGRVLSRSSVKLTVPWDTAGEATVRLFLHGGSSGQRVQLDVNGRRAGVVEVPAQWEQVLVPIPSGLLKAGENEIRLTARTSSNAGGSKTYGLYHALELVPGTVERSEEWPALTPVTTHNVGGQSRSALDGFARMSMYVEVPPTAWLRVDTSGAEGARFVARATSADGAATTLLDTKATSSRWTTHFVDLAAHAGQLVRLDLETTGDGAWGKPFIGLAEAPVAERPAPIDNVILLVVDALRSDRLALYGETRVQTPRFTEAAARNGAVFRHNIAAAPSSPPSHGSIQTGMIPRVHGVTGDKGRINANTPLLSSQLKEAGIKTAYIGNNSFGMNRLREPGKWDVFKQPARGIDCSALVEEVLEFASEQKKAGERFFVSALPFEPHTPYRYHAGISEKYHDGSWGPPVGKSVDGYLLGDVVNGKKQLNEDQWAQLRALYDGEVEYMDRCFGDLVDGLAEQGLADSTAIVLTSDHGEGMFEHKKLGHAYGHYAELSNVPFVVFAPGVIEAGPRNIEVATSCIDVAPTVLDLMGVEPSPKVQGESLLPLLQREGPWVPRIVSAEYGRSYALKSLRWKLIVDYDGTQHFYDNLNDPLEQKNLIEEDAFALRYLRDQVGFFLEHRSEWRASTWGTWANHGAGFVESRGQ